MEPRNPIDPEERELTARITDLKRQRGPSYKPRTRHLKEDGTPRYTNRLFLETSPYLLQHAHNPVDWWPWGDEAFAEAARTKRPVLLSVGYSTCHWCHVMEEESFEDEGIAAYINAHYLPIKVDREERPDIDGVYMAAVMALTGQGGWPMTVWLTPDRQPFFGGTYFPPHDGDRGARTGFLTLLQQLRHAYDTQPERVSLSAAEIVEAIKSRLDHQGQGALPDEDILHRAFRYYARNFDRTFGGLMHAPKFPSSLPIRFLLRYHARFGDSDALDMAEKTLQAMAAGGLYDQVGGGFHRYSVDEEWLVPHFEKMLYDNALLAVAYTEAWQLTGKPFYQTLAREILDYVSREMTTPNGAFYAATDADSLNPERAGDREEGWFFTWTPTELRQTLGDDLAHIASVYYGVSEGGNFEGRNILHRVDDVTEPPTESAKVLGIDANTLEKKIAEAKSMLYAARAMRPAPLRDDKILTAWNGLMISAFAKAGFAFSHPPYIAQAQRAADFILMHMRGPDRRLKRSYIDGQARFAAYLEDYTFFIAALLDLFEVGAGIDYADAAMELDQLLARHFEDKPDSSRSQSSGIDNGAKHYGGAAFLTADDHETLIVREKPNYDGAVPSGNSVHALNLLRLYDLTSKDEYRLRVNSLFEAFGDTLARTPAAMSELLLAVDKHTAASKQVVLIAPRAAEQLHGFLDELRPLFLPYVTLCPATDRQTRTHGERLAILKGRSSLEGRAIAYVCEGTQCLLPATDIATFLKQLNESPSHLS